MIAGYFSLQVKNQTGINWLASKALPELGTALPQLVQYFYPYTLDQYFHKCLTLLSTPFKYI
jgi:hypothetical protein